MPAGAITPYFNGHIHAPRRSKASGYACGVRDGSNIYLPHFLFSLYRKLGPHTVKSFISAVVNDLLGESRSLTTSGFASGGIVTLRHQPDEERYLLHFLYGDPRLRGETVLGPLEAIDEVPRLAPFDISLNLPKTLRNIVTWDGDAVQYQPCPEAQFTFQTRTLRGHDLYILNF